MKIAIAGCLGRMGRTLVEAAGAASGIGIVAGSVQDASELQTARALFDRAGFTNAIITQDAEHLVESADALIDFTTPEYSLALAGFAAAQTKIHIIGTTGFTAEQTDLLEKHGLRARIVQSGNFSIGVNVVAQLVEQAAQALGKEYDIEIIEMHHRHKKDSPSGTALLLAEAAAKGRGVALENARRHYAEGQIGAREEGTIGIVARRGGEVVGEHTVTFAGDHELIDISHRSFSRAIYAQGAFKAALWAKDQPPGLYHMRDVVKK